jgi:hypothetical protein
MFMFVRRPPVSIPFCLLVLARKSAQNSFALFNAYPWRRFQNFAVVSRTLKTDRGQTRFLEPAIDLLGHEFPENRRRSRQGHDFRRSQFVACENEGSNHGVWLVTECIPKGLIGNEPADQNFNASV